jgi:hypothetical protein
MTKRQTTPGEISILNVGDGDTKLSFDKKNPAERIRAARIVADMLKRGYALLIEQPAGSGNFVRAQAFDEEVCEYVIADFDPITAAEHDAQEEQHGDEQNRTNEATASTAGTPAPAGKRTYRKRVKADGARAVAVAPISGG